MTKPAPPRGPTDLEGVISSLSLAADPGRLAILMHLGDAGETGAGELCRAMGSIRGSFLNRLMLLRAGALIIGRREGKRVKYSLSERGRLVMSAVEALGRIERGGDVP